MNPNIQTHLTALYYVPDKYTTCHLAAIEHYFPSYVGENIMFKVNKNFTKTSGINSFFCSIVFSFAI